MNSPIRIGILGASGKMGRQIIHLIETQFKDRAVVAAKASEKNEIESLLKSDVVIDFSTPEGLQSFLTAKSSQHPALVVGTTGIGGPVHDQLMAYAEKARVLQAPNFSLGVFIMSQMLKDWSPVLTRLGYTPVLTEAHHVHKKDAPSGTALRLQKSVRPDAPELVQTHCVRAGEVIGDHDVCFYGESDRLQITHHAQDRSIFARGAIECALWLVLKKERAGFFTLENYFESLEK